MDVSGSSIGGHLWVRSKEGSDSLWTESTLSVAGDLTLVNGDPGAPVPPRRSDASRVGSPGFLGVPGLIAVRGAARVDSRLPDASTI